MWKGAEEDGVPVERAATIWIERRMHALPTPASQTAAHECHRHAPTCGSSVRERCRYAQQARPGQSWDREGHAHIQNSQEMNATPAASCMQHVAVGLESAGQADCTYPQCEGCGRDSTTGQPSQPPSAIAIWKVMRRIHDARRLEIAQRTVLPCRYRSECMVLLSRAHFIHVFLLPYAPQLGAVKRPFGT